MNLQLNPSQLLALYETLVSVMTTSTNVESNTHLMEVKQKIQAGIIDVLNGAYKATNEDKFSTWSKHEQERISKLNADLENLKTILGDKVKC